MSFLRDMYAHLPPSIQNLAVTLYGYKLYLREYGPKLERELKLQEERERLSSAAVEAYQNRKLAALIEHCYQNVPYYQTIMKERALKPSDITTSADLTKLPILTKDSIKNNTDALIARNFKKSDLIMGHTSGTTGSPLEFYYDSPSCLIKNAVDWRQKRWAGLNPGDRLAFFLGQAVVSPSQSKPPYWRKNRALNHLLCSSFHLSPDNLTSYIKALHDFNPKAVEGYPSTLFIIAQQLIKTKMTIPVKAAFTSSETLHPQQREAIETAFECKLFDFYGAAERVAFATECEKHEGKHMNEDFGITEILDGNGDPAKPGELGHLVATGLHNYAMPLIRYRTNDVTAISLSPCSCGRSFPLMADVTTKAEDIITTPDGRYISSSTLTHPFKPLHTVIESQIIQEDLSHITVKIVTATLFEENERERLIKELRLRVGPDIAINIEIVDEIARTASGKFRWVISKVPLKF